MTLQDEECFSSGKVNTSVVGEIGRGWVSSLEVRVLGEHSGKVLRGGQGAAAEGSTSGASLGWLCPLLQCTSGWTVLCAPSGFCMPVEHVLLYV